MFDDYFNVVICRYLGKYTAKHDWKAFKTAVETMEIVSKSPFGVAKSLARNFYKNRTTGIHEMIDELFARPLFYFSSVVRFADRFVHNKNFICRSTLSKWAIRTRCRAT